MSTPTPQSPEQPTTVLPDVDSNTDATGDAASDQLAPNSYPAAPPLPQRATTLAEMNAFAMIAIVLAFIQPIAGIVFGHMGLHQIKRNGDAGRGVALTALIIGYVMVAGVVLAIVTYFAFIIIMIATMGAAFSEFDPSAFDDSF